MGDVERIKGAKYRWNHLQTVYDYGLRMDGERALPILTIRCYR